MRHTSLLTALVLGLLWVPMVQGIDVVYPKADDAPITVDLIEDHGETISWNVDVKAAMEGGCLQAISHHSDASSAVATLKKRVDSNDESSEITLGLVRNTIYTPSESDPNTFDTNTVFKGSLGVKTLALVEGTWDLSLRVADRFGASHDCTDDRTLEATADDDESPIVVFPNADDDGVIILKTGQHLQPQVSDALLGAVEYRVDRMPPGKFFALKAPYSLSSQSFFPGSNELTIRAHDRAGNPMTEVTHTVLKDEDAPELSVSFPRSESFYVGAFTPINITVEDLNDYTVVVRLQGVTSTFDGVGGVETSKHVPFAGSFLGQSQLVVTATDTFGNSAQFAQLVNVTNVETAARILSIEVVEENRIVGETVELEVTMEQIDGLAEINFTVSESKALGNMTTPMNGTVSEVFPIENLLPGTHVLTIRAEADPDVILLDALNLTKEVTVEVFLARVHVGDDAYHIRTNQRGLPNAAVGPDGKAYPLELVERGDHSVFTWEAEGETFFFDPAGERDQVFSPEEETTDTDDNDAPGLGVMLMLGALVGIAFVIRRRS